MNEKYSSLFTPWKIGNCEIKNRIVQVSMGGTSLFGWLEPCHFDKEAAYHILNRAQNNVGLVLPGMQCVRDTMGIPGRHWLYQNKRMFRELAEWMPEFHKTGAKLFIQLSAGMGRSMAINQLMVDMLQKKALGAVAKGVLDVDYVCASSSETPNRWYPEVKSRALTKEEIHEMIEAFGKTAKMLMDAGVDGVEIHAVHEGYLLDQFAIANMNYRTDEYGGSFENRYRFAVEIVQEIKKLPRQGLPRVAALLRRLQDEGLRHRAPSPARSSLSSAAIWPSLKRPSSISRTPATTCSTAITAPTTPGTGRIRRSYMPPNCNIADVEHIKNFTTKPVVCAGKMEPEFAAKEIAEGRIDAMGVGRQNLVDPEWINKLLEDREEEIKPCINCHNACFNFNCSKGTPNMQPMDDALHLARCALTPPTMQHNKYKIVPTKNPKKVAIVGGGIGGMECALVLKKRGHTPVIYEKSDKLGGMYNYASAMSFKEADKKLLEWYDRELKKAGIEVHLNTEIDPINPLTRQYDEVIICTGAVPKKLPVPGFNKTITFEELLTGDKDHGDKVVFFGGGQSACEAAYELVLQGKHPIIVEYANDLIATPGTCLANASFLREMLVFKKVPIYLEHSICEIGDGYVMVKPRSGGDAFKVECDSVVNGLGFRPAPVAPAGKHVRQVGTAAKWGNLRNVIWGAWDVCMKI